MNSTITLPPWAVVSMPTVWLSDCDPVNLARSFRPVTATACDATRDAGVVRYGQVLWASRTVQGDIAVAWDWVELQERVMTLADPMQVLSNVQLRLDDGFWMNERHRILWLNDLIGALPWQTELAAPGSASCGAERRLAA